MAIRAQKRHTIASSNAQFVQPSGKPANPLGHLRVSKAHVAANNTELIWKLLLGVSQKTNWS
jgi:hypothetical protein